MPSSSQSSNFVVERDYDGHPKICDCGLKAPRWTSMSDANPGRRFFSCPNYKNPAGRCNFFVWYDEQMSSRAKEVIIQQRDICKALKSENFDLRKENMELKKNVKHGIGDDYCLLKDEICGLKCKLKEEARNNRMYRILLFMSWMLLVFVVVFGLGDGSGDGSF